MTVKAPEVGSLPPELVDPSTAERLADDRPIRIVATVSVRQGQSFPSRICRPFNRERLADDQQIRKSPDKFPVTDSWLLPPKLVDASTANGWRMIDQSGLSQQFSHRKSVTSTRISRPFNRERLADDQPIRTAVTVSVRQSQSFPSRICRPFNRERLADDQQIRKSPDNFSRRQLVTTAQISRPFNRERLADDRPIWTAATVQSPQVCHFHPN